MLYQAFSLSLHDRQSASFILWMRVSNAYRRLTGESIRQVFRIEQEREKNVKAKLVRSFTVKSADKQGGDRHYRLLTAGKNSNYYVDYYILQSKELDELGADRWNTELQVPNDSDTDPSTLLLFRLLAGEGVTSTVPE